jgi:hypothetical protein
MMGLDLKNKNISNLIGIINFNVKCNITNKFSPNKNLKIPIVLINTGVGKIIIQFYYLLHSSAIDSRRIKSSSVFSVLHSCNKFNTAFRVVS